MVLRLRVRPWVLLLLGLVFVALVGVGLYKFSGQPHWVTLYYKDPQGLYLVPVAERLNLPADGRRAAQQTLDRLIDQVPAHLMGALPAGSRIEVKGWSAQLATVQVQLRGDSLGSGEEQLLAGAVVRTAGDLGAREVQLSLVDAKNAPYDSEHLDLSQPLSPTDPGMENLYLGGEGGGLAVMVYYRLSGSGYLVPLRVPLPVDQQSAPLRGSFALLAAGPPADQRGILAPSLEAPERWRWLGIDGKTVQLAYQGQDLPSLGSLNALVLTLTDSGQAEAVAVQHHPPDGPAVVGPYDLSRPLVRPRTVNTLAAR